MVKIPAHTKLGLSELAYNLAWSQGYRHYQDRYRDRADVVGYRKGTALRKAFNQGLSAARREYALV